MVRKLSFPDSLCEILPGMAPTAPGVGSFNPLCEIPTTCHMDCAKTAGVSILFARFHVAEAAHSVKGRAVSILFARFPA